MAKSIFNLFLPFMFGHFCFTVKRQDWMAWAKRTTGFSGADLAGLINEAAMAAAREGSSAVGERHLQMAYSKALIGIPSGRHQSAAEMNVTAFHEAGFCSDYKKVMNQNYVTAI